MPHNVRSVCAVLVCISLQKFYQTCQEHATHDPNAEEECRSLLPGYLKMVLLRRSLQDVPACKLLLACDYVRPACDRYAYEQGLTVVRALLKYMTMLQVFCNLPIPKLHFRDPKQSSLSLPSTSCWNRDRTEGRLAAASCHSVGHWKGPAGPASVTVCEVSASRGHSGKAGLRWVRRRCAWRAVHHRCYPGPIRSPRTLPLSNRLLTTWQSCRRKWTSSRTAGPGAQAEATP